MPAVTQPMAPTSNVGAAGSLLSNSVAMGAANLLSRGLAYGYFTLMARRLEARYIGAYALLVTTGMLVELVANLGFDKILIREIAVSPDNEGQGYFQAALPIRLGMALLCGLAAWSLLMVFFFKDSLLVGPFSSALFLAGIFPLVAARNCESFLTAHERLLPIAAAQLSERLVIFGAVVLLFAGVIGFKALLCFTPVAAVARMAMVAAFTRQQWKRGIAAKRPNLRRLIRQATELLSVEILAQVYFRSDVFLLAKMGGLRETGIYQIAYKIFDCCLSLFSGFLQAAYPRLVRDRSRRALQNMLAIGMGLLTIPVATIILWRHVILGALRPEYVAGSTSLIWLMLTVPLVYITTTLANAAIVGGRVRMLIGLAVLLIVVNVGLNLLLIPKWSINGAAFSTFACELLSALVLGPVVFKKWACPDLDVERNLWRT